MKSFEAVNVVGEAVDCPLGGDKENDCVGCIYSIDYHFVDGECVSRKNDRSEPEYEVIEDAMFFRIEDAGQFRSVVERLNETIGFEAYKVEDVLYPYEFMVDTQEILYMRDMHQNRFVNDVV